MSGHRERRQRAGAGRGPRRLTLQERGERKRRAARPRTRPVPHPFLLPDVNERP